MIETQGGVTAAEGFKAGGIHSGIRRSQTKKDLAMIVSQVPAVCAGMFTKNVVKAAPVKLDMNVVKGGRLQAIMANSGIANTCAPGCEESAAAMQQLAASSLGISPSLVAVSSTGVIGLPLDVEPMKDHMQELLASLTSGPEGSDSAAHAIMTTDTRKKEAAYTFRLGGKVAHLGGICKGSGMIHPNMGTMLCYLTTDAAIDRPLLDKALREACRLSFNRISVDGDTSTNDTLLIMANALAGNPLIQTENEDFRTFQEVLTTLCQKLARNMARDGEGAHHLITCTVSGASSESQAETLARSIISSTLTKAAIFGNDANWGRVLCAMGYAGTAFDPDRVDIYFRSGAGTILVCEKGHGLAFDEDAARKILEQDEIEILADLHEGDQQATCWGCDITYDYIRINGDYRT